MSNNIKVRILADLKSAKEINPLGETIEDADNDFESFPLPICFDPHDEQRELYLRQKKIIALWKEAEESLEVFQIIQPVTTDPILYLINKNKKVEYQPGKIYEAQVISSGKIRIL